MIADHQQRLDFRRAVASSREQRRAAASAMGARGVLGLLVLAACRGAGPSRALSIGHAVPAAGLGARTVCPELGWCCAVDAVAASA